MQEQLSVENLIIQLAQQQTIISQLRNENRELRDSEQSLKQRIFELEYKLDNHQSPQVKSEERTDRARIPIFKFKHYEGVQVQKEQIERDFQNLNVSPLKSFVPKQESFSTLATNLFNIPRFKVQEENKAVELDEDMESMLLAQKLQEEEENQFQQRLYMMQPQFNPDEMDYEQLQELQEKIGFVSKGFTAETIDCILQKYQCEDSEHNPDCTICFSSETNIRLACNHQFHHECLHSWLSQEKTCPLCKVEIKIQ